MVLLTTPSGQNIAYAYTNHQITSMTVNGTSLLSAVTYFPFGAVSGWTWGNSSLVSRTYDTDGNIKSITTAGDTLNFTPDAAFRITSIVDTGSSANSWSFTNPGYDLLDRLQTASNGSGTTYTWQYDANGNRLSQSGTNATTYTPVTGNNQLHSNSNYLTRTYGYDNSGNTTSYAALSFTYNNRGRLATATNIGTATSANYVYDAVGQLVLKTVNNVSTILMYDESGHLLGEYTNTGALIQETVWMGDIPVATLRPNGSAGCTSNPVCVFYVHTDQLNAPRKITQPSNNAIVWRWDADPFGTTQPTGTLTYNLRVPGQYYQAETGLNYNYFRDYDPQTGRYVESDPIGLAGRSYSTYAYAAGNPISNVDPTGLLCFNFNQFANDIEQNRFDLGATAATLGLTLGIGTMPKVPSELRGLGVAQGDLNPYTSQLSRLAGRLGIRGLRDIGRTSAGIAASTAATLATVFEGFYDLSVEAQAAINATSSSDCGCQH
jgi:RHS repeat-associated protein